MQYQRGMVFPGTTTDYLSMPTHTRFGLNEWTLEAWVYPTAAQGGTIVHRDVAPGVTNFFLALDSSLRPVVGLGSSRLMATDTARSLRGIRASIPGS